jgi:hypothetical protein
MTQTTGDGETLDDLKQGLEAMLGGFRQMLEIQAVHGEMLRKLLEAATAEPSGDLEELLRRLVSHDEGHAQALVNIQESLERLPALLQTQSAG